MQQNKIRENLRLNSIPKVFRVKEYILEEGSAVEIVGSTQPIDKKKPNILPQSERLFIAGKEGFDFIIGKPQQTIFSDKGLLLSIMGGGLLVSVGLGLLARSYSIVNSDFTFALFVLFGTFMIFLYLFIYYKAR